MLGYGKRKRNAKVKTSMLGCGSHQVPLLPRAVNSETDDLSYAGWRVENLRTKILVTIFALAQVVVSIKRSLFFLLGGVLKRNSIIVIFSAYKNFFTALICAEIT